MSAKGRRRVIDRAEKASSSDNSDSIQSTLPNADVFSKALADNAPSIDTTLKNLAEISKTVQRELLTQAPQITQNPYRRLRWSLDKTRPFDDVETLSAKSDSVIDRAVHQLLADNSGTLHRRFRTADVFAKAADNARIST